MRRLDQFRRDRSQRASSARSLAQRWAHAGGGDATAPSGEDDLALHRRHAGAGLSRSRRAQPRQWQFRARQWPRRRRRADLVAGARALYRGRRTDRHRRAAAASCWRRRSRRTRSKRASPTRSRTREEISFDRGAMALRARRKRTLHAITLSEAPMALSPSAETARIFADGLVAAGLDRLPWSKAAEAMARPRDVPAQGGRR